MMYYTVWWFSPCGGEHFMLISRMKSTSFHDRSFCTVLWAQLIGSYSSLPFAVPVVLREEKYYFGSSVFCIVESCNFGCKEIWYRSTQDSFYRTCIPRFSTMYTNNPSVNFTDIVNFIWDLTLKKWGLACIF